MRSHWPMRYQRDLTHASPAHRQKRRWRDDNMDACTRSSNVCVGCTQKRYVQAHHLFGRHNQVREPLASHPAFLVPLCRDCHNAIHDANVALRRRLQWEGLRRVRNALGCQLPCRIGAKGWQPVNVAHWLERMVTDEQVYASAHR